MTALAVTKFPIKKFSLVISEDKPQFVYIGIVDEKYIVDGTTDL